VLDVQELLTEKRCKNGTENKLMAKIYLASSWRNPFQPQVLSALREWGHAVYDFRSDARSLPRDEQKFGVAEPPATAFAWAEMDPKWQDWAPYAYRHQLQTSARAAQGFVGDLRGMEWADTCVMCLPCGNSAHIEAGYMKGRSKRLVIYWHNNDKVTHSGQLIQLENGNPAPEKTWKFEPDLMYLLGDNLVVGLDELRESLVHGG
jgi:hypothetical protein